MKAPQEVFFWSVNPTSALSEIKNNLIIMLLNNLNAKKGDITQ